MKILYLATQPELRLGAKTGYGTHMREMIRAFEQLGHEVRPVIAGDAFATEPTSHAPATGAPSRLKRWVPGLLWQTLRDLRRFGSDVKLRSIAEAEIRAFQPDLIYERGSYGSALGVRLAQANKIRHALEWNAPYLEERVALSGRSAALFWAKRLATEAKSKTDLAVVVSDRLAHMSRIHELSPRYLVTHNAIRHDFIPPLPKWNRSEFGWTDDHTVVGFVGSIFPWHGVDRLIAALPTVVDTHPEVRCLIVGDGEIKKDLESLAVALGVSELIHFTGSVAHDEALDAMRIMDICAMPQSNAYGSPVKIFEYALWSKPIIVHGTDPVAEVMRPGLDGYLSTPNSFAATLLEVLDRPEEAALRGETWHNRVMREHTWQRNAERVLGELFSGDR